MPKASDLNRVTLRNITLSTGGTYKCEVSADRPSFRTLSQQGDMFIVGKQWFRTTKYNT